MFRVKMAFWKTSDSIGNFCFYGQAGPYQSSIAAWIRRVSTLETITEYTMHWYDIRNPEIMCVACKVYGGRLHRSLDYSFVSQNKRSLRLPKQYRSNKTVK